MQAPASSRCLQKRWKDSLDFGCVVARVMLIDSTIHRSMSQFRRCSPFCSMFCSMLLPCVLTWAHGVEESEAESDAAGDTDCTTGSEQKDRHR
jgi:hypothetical protein